MSLQRSGAGLVAMLAVGAVALAGCTRTTAGHGNHPVNVSSIQLDTSSFATPTFPAPTFTTSIPVPGSSTAGSSSSVHPVPSAPLRTASVDSGGRHYDIKIWAEVHEATCADHAYGQVATYLAAHPCRGLVRQLATTTVNGKAVGFNVASLSIPGSDAQHPYDNAAQFRQLVEADGTGNVDDLLRDGWRLPSGPTSVPQPNAFETIGQDSGINIYDMWYLAGPTPHNDPPLLQMAQDIFLQY